MTAEAGGGASFSWLELRLEPTADLPVFADGSAGLTPEQLTLSSALIYRLRDLQRRTFGYHRELPPYPDDAWPDDDDEGMHREGLQVLEQLRVELGSSVEVLSMWLEPQLAPRMDELRARRGLP